MSRWSPAETELVLAWLLRLGSREAIDAFLGRAYALRSVARDDAVLYGGPDSGWLRVRYRDGLAIGAVALGGTE